MSVGAALAAVADRRLRGALLHIQAEHPHQPLELTQALFMSADLQFTLTDVPGGAGERRDAPQTIGSWRGRSPLSEAMALATAGAMGGVPGSPAPPTGALGLVRMSTVIRFGPSLKRITW